MGIVEKNYQELLSMTTSVARKQLGGPNGSDYSNYADDIAQNVMVMLLEMEAAGKLRQNTLFGLAKGMAQLRSITYMTNEARRREIEQEHGAAMNRTLTGQSAESLAADPFDLMTTDEMMDRIDNLSPLVRRTTQQYYIEGWTVCGMAATDGVTEDVVYKRLQRARDIVTGEDND